MILWKLNIVYEKNMQFKSKKENNKNRNHSLFSFNTRNFSYFKGNSRLEKKLQRCMHASMSGFLIKSWLLNDS